MVCASAHHASCNQMSRPVTTQPASPQHFLSHLRLSETPSADSRRSPLFGLCRARSHVRIHLSLVATPHWLSSCEPRYSTVAISPRSCGNRHVIYPYALPPRAKASMPAFQIGVLEQHRTPSFSNASGISDRRVDSDESRSSYTSLSNLSLPGT